MLMQNFINQMEPWFDEHESEALQEYMLNGGWVTEFKKTREFEKVISNYVGSEYCSVVTNGTVALSVALLACGVKAGDEVVVPDYTMVATPNAVELIGAKAIFTDIESSSFCMDFEQLKNAVTPQTKAVIVVLINGRYPEKFDKIIEFCKNKKLWLIEDAAQALGSNWRGRHLGTIGDIGTFSFSAPKVITTGQGGALTTNNKDVFAQIVKIRDFGRECGGEDHYLVKGWNFKFTDIQAVIGLEQMKKLQWRVGRKKEICARYYEKLSGVSEIQCIETNLKETSPWFIDILCDNRDELKEYLKTRGIGSRRFYPPLHSELVYGYNDLNFPITQYISSKGLWLPSSSFLSNNEIDEICSKIMEFYR